jgi:CrcB protein
MQQIASIAFGGALGALCRFWLASYVNVILPSKLHLGTLIVNIIGSFLIGIVYVLIVEKFYLHPDWRNVFIVGFLGAFTTFSTFSLESIQYIENGQPVLAGLYILASVVLCLVATGMAIYLTRAL